MGTTQQRKIFITRHGERADLASDWECPSSSYAEDPPLTRTGEEQARLLGDALLEENVTLIITSPFQRCVRTAVLAASQLNDALRARFREDSFGQECRVCVDAALCERLSLSRYYKTGEVGPRWRGLQWLVEELDEEEEEDGVIDTSYEPVCAHNLNKTAFPESTSSFRQRAKTFVEKLKEVRTEGNVLLVGHVSSVKAVLSALLPTLVLMKPVSFCSLTECIMKRQEQTTGKVTVVKGKWVCEQSHLPKSLTRPSAKARVAWSKHVLGMGKGVVYSATHASTRHQLREARLGLAAEDDDDDDSTVETLQEGDERDNA